MARIKRVKCNKVGSGNVTKAAKTAHAHTHTHTLTRLACIESALMGFWLQLRAHQHTDIELKELVLSGTRTPAASCSHCPLPEILECRAD